MSLRGGGELKGLRCGAGWPELELEGPGALGGRDLKGLLDGLGFRNFHGLQDLCGNG